MFFAGSYCHFTLQCFRIGLLSWCSRLSEVDEMWFIARPTLEFQCSYETKKGGGYKLSLVLCKDPWTFLTLVAWVRGTFEHQRSTFLLLDWYNHRLEQLLLQHLAEENDGRGKEWCFNEFLLLCLATVIFNKGQKQGIDIVLSLNFYSSIHT